MSDIDIRDAFFDELYNIAKEDPSIVFLTADMSAHSLIRFQKDLSSQYINVGVAEQNMISVAAGLALGGKTVFAYGITPFVTLRCYEQIKIDLCCMNLPVTLIGSGTGYTYYSDGPTHHATHDIAVMRTLPEMTILNPSDPVTASAFARLAYKTPGPKYIRMDKGKLPQIYDEKDNDFSNGLACLRKGQGLTIISTGIMVHQVFKVAEELAKCSVEAGIVDLYRITPVNVGLLLRLVEKSKRIVTVEENSITGGIGSLVSEVLADNGRTIPLKRIAIQDEHCFKYGDREWMHSLYGLDVDSISKNILEWLRQGQSLDSMLSAKETWT